LAILVLLDERLAMASAANVSTALAAWVGVVAAVVGGYAGLNTYQSDIEKRVDDQIKAPFELATEFNGEHFLDIRSRLFDSDIACRQATASATQQEVVALVDFFDRVQICVEAGLCDERTARALFEPYANIFGSMLWVHIEGTRKADAAASVSQVLPYGYGIERFATVPLQQACSAPPPS
jgi:hypothetical protein